MAMNDRYGSYYNLTGYEAPRRCFWCGTEVDGRRRYCCGEHRELYYNHFRWPEASAWCLRRQENRCPCGNEACVVHHIIPLNGAYRLWNILNRPENLVALCYKHHGEKHAAAVKLELPKPDIYEVARERGQLIFEEMLI